jgi:tetratricopeptide (TPR) repeat protein
MMKRDPAKPEPATTGKKGKLILFKTVAILLPFFFIIVIELFLRLFNYGHNLNLFVQDEDYQDCVVLNNYASEKFFTNQVNATIGNAEPFKKQKPAGTTRIFILGESTTLGYPYMHNGSFHRWLKYRLMQMYPDADFEVINLSLTAVNSYTVREFAKEVVNYSPDAVLIYTGHNEYYGALGVASTSNVGSNRWFTDAIIGLKQYRFVQLLFNTYSTAGQMLSGKKTDASQNLMERMAADQKILYNSAAYQQGIEQFDSNINSTCAWLSQHKIPVFISTIVSNEKDLKPLVSDSAGANSATTQYQMGLTAYERNDFAAAKQLFIKAKELDLLRFRAPEEINKRISSITKRYPGVFLVDTRHLFENNSPHGILGAETLLEHVHPNLKGYSLLSEAFYQAISQHHIIPAKPVQNLSFEQLQQNMPVTTVDSLFGAYSINILKQRWPFNLPAVKMPQQLSPEQTIAMNMAEKGLLWNDAMDQLMNHYRQTNDKQNMLKVAEAVMLEYPFEPAFYVEAGKLSAQLNNYAKAVNYLQRGFALKPSLELARIIFTIELQADEPEKAIHYINYALAQHPDDIQINNVKDLLTQIISLKEKLKQDSTNPTLKQQISNNYTILVNSALAGKYANKQK